MGYARLAFRALFRTPFVTTVAIVSLALGIGANAAIFSLTDQILLKPLPVPAPERLVYLTAPGPKPIYGNTTESGDEQSIFSYLMYRDLERSQSVLTGLAAFLTVKGSFATRGEPFTGDVAMVSGSYFHTLGLTPALGRLIGPDDDAVIGNGSVAVLSYSFWQGRLGGDPHVLESSITVNGQSMTIVGVAPRDFEGFTFGQHPNVFVPLTMTTKVAGDFGFQ
ncbi:MAG TPA: ABC transporter permease, partial [Gemmatimonadales bacterium]|nr:ABC transporter permease [Gemmatimonadales bacterium]